MARRRMRLDTAIRLNVPRNSRVLVAVSGGIDSVALLRAVTLARRLFSKIGAVHVDHRLRPESAEDASFVRDLARQYELPCFVHTVCTVPTGNVESWGREERYKFFSEILAAEEYDWVLTAHTANDVAETLLMRLMAGKEPNSILERDPVRKVLRPFLSITREQILSFGEQHQLPWREDATNQSEAFLRNRVRHLLIPFLRDTFDPSVVDSLAFTGTELARDQGYFHAALAGIMGRMAKCEWGQPSWLDAARKELMALPEVLQWRLLEEVLKTRLGYTIGPRKAREALKLLRRKTGQMDVQGWQIVVKNGRLEVLPL